MPVFAPSHHMVFFGMMDTQKGTAKPKGSAEPQGFRNESLDMIGRTIGCEGNTIRVRIISKYSPRNTDNQITEDACHVARVDEQKSMYELCVLLVNLRSPRVHNGGHKSTSNVNTS